MGMFSHLLLCLATAAFLLPLEALAQEIDLQNHPGKAIYQKQCVECHAENGKGVEDKADDPLEGSRSLESLAGRIERTMPEDEEDLCVGEDAHAVAEYIYHAFYSAEARARNTPARIDLTRLTVPQYRNSIADLIVDFHGTISPSPEKGLKAWYYGGRGFNDRKEYREQKKKDRFERIDPRIKFDFAEGVPPQEEAKEFTPEEFSVRWEGRKQESISINWTITLRLAISPRGGMSWIASATRAALLYMRPGRERNR